MKTIFVAPKYTAIVNDKDFEFITSIGPWTYCGGRAVKWYTDEKGHRHRIWMDRVILERKLGHELPKGATVEHRSERRLGKEGRLDNSRANLRIVTKKKLSPEAKRILSDMTGGCEGISINRGKYAIHIWYYGNRLHLGGASTLRMALCIYGFGFQVLWNKYTPEVTIGELHPIVKKLIIKRITDAGVNPKFLYLDV